MDPADTLRLTLVPAPGDDAAFSPAYQAELRQFHNLARADGETRAVRFGKDSADGGDGLAGEFMIRVTHVAAPALAAAASAWMLGRAGRRLRLKIGGTEVEASSPNELYGLLNLMRAVSDGTVKSGTGHR
ncbi:hypothetical protein [Paraburkholderia strydomiana]|uniref:hypothetical protein n=1 Tax=Paraburkholderia strydomiana TaxID=1245417 RepID=UPI001BEA49E3|nr:hypothetical protein [Paraburkholderia strydomiana]MBT2792934.1 hypothetical protein [Paraburkholderia strydomiana]